MGVRGLTSYIAQNADKYLESYELHDCNLVIDGDSLASNLYSWHSQCNSAFGGDYDQHFRCVVNFFAMLEKCNVTPYVLLDGGYERKKLETVRQRLRSKIGAVKHINPFRCIPLFPLMLREVFVEAVKTTGCRLMRCLFEADDEVSVLARKLNCPVLSYDSDFYIHNVLYIPSISLSFRVHKRKIPKKTRKQLSPDEENPATYYFLDCCIYSVSNLVRNQLEKNMLPLFATLLGNDYINGRLLRKFYANVSLKNIGKKSSPQQRRIIGLLRWLQNETVDSAIGKVLSRFEKERRPWMLRQIEAAMGGYNREDSKAYEFFQLENETTEVHHDPIECTYNIPTEMDIDDEEMEEICDSDTDDDDDDDEVVDQDNPDSKENGSDVDPTEEEKMLIIADKKEEQQFHTQQESTATFEPPDWVVQKVLAAELPRFIIDLLHLKLYVNSPQIENFVLNDSNEIALPILELIFTLLHYPEPNHFQYLTRVHRISNVHSKKIESISLQNPFDPAAAKNVEFFGVIIEDFDRKFALIAGLPEYMRLFVMAMGYMAEKNSKVTPPFYHSLLIGLLLLSKADEDIQPVTRDPRLLHKKYGSLLDSVTSKDSLNEPVGNDDDSMETDTDTMGQSVTKQDSAIFLRNTLALFQISDKIREKHTDFSSTIVHTFAEFQAIIFNLNCLNSLLNKPFQPIFVSKSFNGTFLYNMYVNLRDRPNIDHYIRHHVFKDCERYYLFYTNILNVCKSIISGLTNVGDKSKTSGKASRNYRRNRRKQKLKTVIGKGQDESIADEAFVDVESEDLLEGEHQFTDSNNKFTALLNG